MEMFATQSPSPARRSQKPIVDCMLEQQLGINSGQPKRGMFPENYPKEAAWSL